MREAYEFLHRKLENKRRKFNPAKATALEFSRMIGYQEAVMDLQNEYKIELEAESRILNRRLNDQG